MEVKYTAALFALRLKGSLRWQIHVFLKAFCIWRTKTVLKKKKYWRQIWEMLCDFLFQIPCADLHEVIDALVEKTAGALQPFLLEEPYEENISEATVHHTRSQIVFFFCLIMFSSDETKLCLSDQRTFQPMMRTEKGSFTRPPLAPCQGLPPCLQNKVCLSLTNNMQTVSGRRRQWSPLSFWCRSLA